MKEGPTESYRPSLGFVTDTVRALHSIAIIKVYLYFFQVTCVDALGIDPSWKDTKPSLK